MTTTAHISSDESARSSVAEALRLLGKSNLILAIHDPSFPAASGEDVGRGSPYSRGAAGFMSLIANLGFNGLQLGPQGMTTRINPSPYDGTIFAKTPLSIALAPLAEDPQWAGLLSRETLERLVAGRPPGSDYRVPYEHVFDAYERALDEVHARFRALTQGAKAAAGKQGEGLAWLIGELERFQRDHHAWLDRNAIYEALSIDHGTDDWRRFAPGVDSRLFCPHPGEQALCEERRRVLHEQYRLAIERFLLAQFIVHEQHNALRTQVREHGLKLFGDLQVGLSPRDVWAHRDLFLSSYLMGAPPSRTNPEGQPWGYPVLDPALHHAHESGQTGPGPAIRFMMARMDKMLSEFDGIRLDHPHGLVCPWVYRADDPDPLHAVQHGARLFSSPHLPDHPDLARYAIVRPDQVGPPDGVRHADAWVRHLDDAQVARYSVLVDAIMLSAHRHGRARSDILCEVLSTMPYPLQRVMERYGLGRFRVMQKANLDDPRDVYRSENAQPADWIMLGNHDTPPIWRVVEGWFDSGKSAAWARYLAEHLAPETDNRAATVATMSTELASDPGKMVQALMADMLVSPASNVMVFFADLLGMREIYNRPGTVSPDNWSLRVPPDYLVQYTEQRARHQALDIHKALAMALRRRGAGLDSGLVARLEAVKG